MSQKSLDLKIMVKNMPNVQDGITKHEKSSKEAGGGDQTDAAEQERKAMENEIKTLREENGQLESQLKFQAQVHDDRRNGNMRIYVLEVLSLSLSKYSSRNEYGFIHSSCHNDFSPHEFTAS
jgi:hypothetical protein